MPEREYDPTLQSPSERRSLLSQGILRLRRLFVQVANITILRTDTITERTPAAGVTVDGVLLKDSGIAGAAVPDGADSTAIHDDTAGEIVAITEKATPVNADLVVIEDSAAGNAKKRVQLGNLPKFTSTDAITAVPFIEYIPFGSEPITGQSYAP